MRTNAGTIRMIDAAHALAFISCGRTDVAGAFFPCFFKNSMICFSSSASRRLCKFLLLTSLYAMGKKAAPKLAIEARNHMENQVTFSLSTGLADAISMADFNFGLSDVSDRKPS